MLAYRETEYVTAREPERPNVPNLDGNAGLAWVLGGSRCGCSGTGRVCSGYHSSEETMRSR